MPKRIIAIGDIHGCSLALDAVLEAIQPDSDDVLVPLGDYVDRGSDSRGVIERLMRLADCCQMRPLMGNHERMMLSSFENYINAPFWVECGGMETLDSYGGSPEAVPEEHLQFLADCLPYYESERHIFLHANYDPYLPLAEQPEDLLYWQHLHKSTPGPHETGKTAIVGHTPQKTGEILDMGHLICLDTYCVGGGWLTAMDVVQGQVWQADRDGQLRPSP